MKYLITENQSNRLNERILSLYRDGKSIDFISKITGYKKKRIYSVVIDEPINENIECGDLTEMVYELYSNKLLKTNFVKDDLILNVIGFDQMSGALSFVIDDTKHKDFVSGLATPYWDGECELPIDYDFYAIKKESKYDEFDISGELFTSVPLVKPDTIRDLINWFNHKYPEIILNNGRRDLMVLRNEYINNN